MSDEEQPVRLLTSKNVYPGRVVRLDVDRVALPGGHVAELEILRHPGAAAVVPLDERGRVLMLRQYRHAAGGWLMEVPAGKLDPGEAPEACALRETEEETGLRPGSLQPMGWIWTTPGFTDEKIWLFLARDLQPGTKALEDDELIRTEWVELDRAVGMATTGGIQDAKTLCALLRVPHHLQAAGGSGV